jgi:hypothetical protein
MEMTVHIAKPARLELREKQGNLVCRWVRHACNLEPGTAQMFVDVVDRRAMHDNILAKIVLLEKVIINRQFRKQMPDLRWPWS